MSTRTSGNLGLVKPGYSDVADIGIVNTNMDAIDYAVTRLQTWKPSTDGTFDQIMRSNGDGTTRWDDAATQEEIGDAVTAWLDENVPKDTTVVIDKSLSVEDAAADAKTTGDQFDDLKEMLQDGTSETSEYHLGFFLDEDGDLCQDE